MECYFVLDDVQNGTHVLQVTETPGHVDSVLQKSNSSARRNCRSSSVTEGQITITLFALDWIVMRPSVGTELLV